MKRQIGVSIGESVKIVLEDKEMNKSYMCFFFLKKKRLFLEWLDRQGYTQVEFHGLSSPRGDSSLHSSTTHVFLPPFSLLTSSL